MTEGEHCILWENGHALAERRGFTMAPLCPLDGHCPETQCTIIELAGRDAIRREKGLAQLRKELTEVQKNPPSSAS